MSELSAMDCMQIIGCILIPLLPLYVLQLRSSDKLNGIKLKIAKLETKVELLMKDCKMVVRDE